MTAPLILINAVILGLETSPTIMASYGHLLDILDHIILAFFGLREPGRNGFWNVVRRRSVQAGPA